MFEDKKQHAHGAVTSTHAVLLCHVSQHDTQHSVPFLPQFPHLEGIESDLRSAVASLVGPGCTVRVQRMMSPLHVHAKSSMARNLMLSMILKAKGRRVKQHCHSGVHTTQSSYTVQRHLQIMSGIVWLCLLCLVKDVVGWCNASGKAWHDDV